MKLAALILFFLLINSQVESKNLYIYIVGKPDAELKTAFLYALKREKIDFSVYTGSKNLEDHLSSINEINSKKKGVFLALDLKRSNTQKIFVATFKTKKTQGKLLRIDEIPSLHFEDSIQIAQYIALTFNNKVYRLPLFPLLGVNMPGLYLKVDGGKEEVDFVATTLARGIKKFSIEENEYASRR